MFGLTCKIKAPGKKGKIGGGAPLPLEVLQQSETHQPHKSRRVDVPNVWSPSSSSGPDAARSCSLRAASPRTGVGMRTVGCICMGLES
ncbi:unnamed protein product [Leptosia nina]|uniref:Uncharacterized protein n=1 Tax=Leptosia nina TaxID=320188 RepID=A0AAV1JS08_9NEOP